MWILSIQFAILTKLGSYTALEDITGRVFLADKKVKEKSARIFPLGKISHLLSVVSASCRLPASARTRPSPPNHQITQNWDDILRVAGSLKLGTVNVTELL